ncbi:MAG: hypothetical protein HZA66_03660 [Rhodopseudomonas palustris]|uniref:Uncharacterized protein n=1 Tax=Rhodopseudomonas palustris TaxID=1076 RepID=A0A933RUM7_RHOPL|nr:hypothetical protein [Rhodopseudomonas palustris]
MAKRPIFVPHKDAPGLVREIVFDIPWAGGFAATQKKKNIEALHKAAAAQGYSPLLEVSTKSDETAGQHLSAFHLKVHGKSGEIPLESAFQGSKVFERGGPFTDLYEAEPRLAKRDDRLRKCGQLIGFEFEGDSFPLQPTTVFYDWLYLRAIYPHRFWLEKRLTKRVKYAGFTDIEFNPSKSVNCQARSCALFVALVQQEKLESVVASPKIFVQAMTELCDGRLLGANESQLAI